MVNYGAKAPGAPFNISAEIMISTKVETLGANTICVRDWSCAGEKLANTTTATEAMRCIATYPGNGYNGSETG